jgi:hypothetical protein
MSKLKSLLIIACCSFELGSSGLGIGVSQALGASSDFLSLCRTNLQGQAGAEKVCTSLNQMFFSRAKTHDIVPFTPTQLGAPRMSVDSKIQFIAFDDPNFVAGVAYCYFVFRNWINPSLVSPDDLGLNSSGFSILNEELTAYQRWLDNSAPGQACKARVEKTSAVPTANLKESLEGHSALIAINPFASLRSNGAKLEAVMADLRLTVNHERVHAYQVLCPDFEKWSRDQWNAQSPVEKSKMRTKYSSYNWNDPKVAAREWAAFTLESKPQEIKKHLGACRL